MPKAKPVSLHPLTFDDALKALIVVDPDSVGLTPKRRKRSRKRKSVTTSNQGQVAVILIQDGVVQQEVSADRVYVLEDDAVSRGIIPTYPTASYEDMLRMIFEADSV